MKTVLILVSLVVLSSLSIYAQKDNIAENLLASAILHNDPPATQDREQSLKSVFGSAVKKQHPLDRSAGAKYITSQSRSDRLALVEHNGE